MILHTRLIRFSVCNNPSQLLHVYPTLLSQNSLISLSLFLSLSLTHTQNAPPPVPSSQTHHAATSKAKHGHASGGVAQATKGVASMSVGDKSQHYKVKCHM